MYSLLEMKNMIVFDIETIAQYKNIEAMSSYEKELWLRKYGIKYKRMVEAEAEKCELANVPFELDANNPNDVYLRFASLTSEFSKVISLSFGCFKTSYTSNEIKNDYKLKTLASDNEVELLNFAKEIIDAKDSSILCGYNIKGFDIPFLTKRYLINQAKLPKGLQMRGKKPWEVNFIDVAEDWKGLQWEMSSLEVLEHIFKVGSSKEENVKGENIGLLYYNGKATLEDMSTYVEQDVKKTMDIILNLYNSQK